MDGKRCESGGELTRMGKDNMSVSTFEANVCFAADIGKVAGNGLATALKGAEVDRKVPAVEVASSHNADHSKVSSLAGDLHIPVLPDPGSEREGSANMGFTMFLPLTRHLVEFRVLKIVLQNVSTARIFWSLTPIRVEWVRPWLSATRLNL
jgi:hypothetical protein